MTPDEAFSTLSSLDSLLNATQDGVVFIDGHSRIVRMNPAAERMFGYTPGELLGKKVNVLMSEPYAAEHDGYVERYERTGQARAIGRIRVVSGRATVRPGVSHRAIRHQARRSMQAKYAAFVRTFPSPSACAANASNKSGSPPWAPPRRCWPMRSAIP